MNDDTIEFEPTRGPLAGILTWSLPVAVIAAAVVSMGGRLDRQELQASGAWAVDSDGDGLPDAQEVVLGTSPNLADSDADGYIDSLEFAAQSNPNNDLSTPSVQDVSVGMSARGGSLGRTTMIFGIYAADGVLDDEAIRFGKVHSGRLLSVPFEWMLTRSSSRSVPIEGGGTVLLVEVELPANQIANAGHVSYYTAVGMPGQPHYQSAAVLEMSWRDGISLLKIATVPSGGGGSSSAQATGGSVYRPIPSEGATVPEGWIPGEICYRTSETVGTSGAVITQEVTSAECQEGWDSYCAGGCAGSVGTTYQTVDPLALVGG